MRYLLDSNILSEPLKPAPNSKVMTKVTTHHVQCATASIVVMELYWGAELLPVGKRRDFFISTYDAWFKQPNSIPVLPFDVDAALWAADQSARLQQAGQVRPWRDTQIAAVAATQNLVLVTRNVNDFMPFQDLKIDNWFD